MNQPPCPASYLSHQRAAVSAPSGSKHQRRRSAHSPDSCSARKGRAFAHLGTDPPTPPTLLSAMSRLSGEHGYRTLSLSPPSTTTRDTVQRSDKNIFKKTVFNTHLLLAILARPKSTTSGRVLTYLYYKHTHTHSEPVWPSGTALGW